jgi:hypothetical protein
MRRVADANDPPLAFPAMCDGHCPTMEDSGSFLSAENAGRTRHQHGTAARLTHFPRVRG